MNVRFPISTLQAIVLKKCLFISSMLSLRKFLLVPVSACRSWAHRSREKRRNKRKALGSVFAIFMLVVFWPSASLQQRRPFSSINRRQKGNASVCVCARSFVPTPLACLLTDLVVPPSAAACFYVLTTTTTVMSGRLGRACLFVRAGSFSRRGSTHGDGFRR